MSALAPDHMESCAALVDWQKDCSCGVGIEQVEIPISNLQVIAVSMARLLVELRLVSSMSEASRLIKQQAVEVVDGAGRRTTGFSEWLPIVFTLRCGKQWRKVNLQ